MIRRQGCLWVLSSPSGGGKTTITQALLSQDPQLSPSISMTTRPPRSHEQEGKDYYFVSTVEFERYANDNFFAEQTFIFGHRYGTPRQALQALLDKGQDIIFAIDWQGARQLRHSFPHHVVTVFILPPSLTELHRRLLHRGQDSPEVMKARLEGAAEDIQHWSEYDYALINKDFEATVAELRTVMAAERLRRHRQTGLSGFVKQLLG